jgi:hypothetical protein
MGNGRSAAALQPTAEVGELKVERALLSVFDKRGVVDFARALNELGVEIISTGGTASELGEAGIETTPIEAYTGFPEILDGRVACAGRRVGGLVDRQDAGGDGSDVHRAAVRVGEVPAERLRGITGIHRRERRRLVDRDARRATGSCRTVARAAGRPVCERGDRDREDADDAEHGQHPLLGELAANH